MTETQISDEIIHRLGLPFKNKDQYMICCPEHNEKRPSCSITKSFKEKSGWIHCFSCGFSKSLKAYYKEKTGHSIIAELGIKDEIPLYPAYRESTDFSSVPEVNFKFEGNLIPSYSSRKGKSWLIKRGFNNADADRFNIRYTSYGKTFNKNNPQEDITTIFNRIVIPIYEKNKLVSLEARDIDGEEVYKINLGKKGLTLEDHPYRKVIYPKLSSTNTLFRLDQLDTKKRLYLVEGIMDVISLQTCSLFDNSTALFKCMPTERQLYLLSRFPEIVIIPNNDAASWTGAKKIFENLGNKIKILPVPSEVKDVNDILQQKYSKSKTIEGLIKLDWLNKVQKASYSYIDASIIKISKSEAIGSYGKTKC